MQLAAEKECAELESDLLYQMQDCPYIVTYQDEDLQAVQEDGKLLGYAYLIRMELPEKHAEEEKPEMSDQTKMMHFLAGKFNEMEQNQQICIGELILQVGKIQDSMNQVQDYMAQILRRMDK